MKTIDQVELRGKRVFIRADLNVPFDDEGKISDETRIEATIPTLSYAVEAGARVILASHVGRPTGKVDPSLSLKPIADRLRAITGKSVTLAPDCIGAEVESLVEQLKPGEILVLENLRFHEAETKNDPAFASALAKLADVYVSDAFATAHRAHASTVGMVPSVEESCAGFTLKRELDYFKKAFEEPARPLVAIFGGAKVSTKLGAIENVSKRADSVLIGGAMANTFLAAQGYGVGKSLHEPDLLDTARKVLESSSCELIVPTDVVVAAEFKAGAQTTTVDIDAIPDDQMAVDIGPKTAAAYKAKIQEAGTVVWNGPMGAFEINEFSAGTYAIVDALIEAPGLSVVGGGDTDLALHRRKAFDKMDYVSTGGGAFLELLEGKKLPAVEILR